MKLSFFPCVYLSIYLISYPCVHHSSLYIHGPTCICVYMYIYIYIYIYIFNYLSWSFALSIHLCISFHLSLSLSIYIYVERESLFDIYYDHTVCYMYSVFVTAYHIQPYVLVLICVCSLRDTA